MDTVCQYIMIKSIHIQSSLWDIKIGNDSSNNIVLYGTLFDIDPKYIERLQIAMNI